jgi:hypothetical protein
MRARPAFPLLVREGSGGRSLDALGLRRDGAEPCHEGSLHVHHDLHGEGIDASGIEQVDGLTDLDKLDSEGARSFLNGLKASFGTRRTMSRAADRTGGRVAMSWPTTAAPASAS